MNRRISCHHYHRDLANRGKKKSPFAANHLAAKEVPYYRLVPEDLVMRNDFFDLTNLIRSVQRAEGNPDCFGKAQGYCDRLDCAWRRYCLGTLQNETTAYKSEETPLHDHESGAKNQLPR